MRVPEPVVVPPSVPAPSIVIAVDDFVKVIAFPRYPGSRASKKRVFASGRRVAEMEGVPPELMMSRSLVNVEVAESEIATRVRFAWMVELESNS